MFTARETEAGSGEEVSSNPELSVLFLALQLVTLGSLRVSRTRSALGQIPSLEGGTRKKKHLLLQTELWATPSPNPTS